MIVHRPKIKSATWVGLLGTLMLAPRLAAGDPPSVSPPATQSQAINNCGALCLATVLRVLGCDCTVDQVYRSCNRSPNSKLTMLDLRNAAQSLGVSARGMQADHERLRSIRKPAILAVRSQPGAPREDHYVVLAAWSPAGVCIVDPATPRRHVYSVADLHRRWNGYVLEIEPGGRADRWSSSIIWLALAISGLFFIAWIGRRKSFFGAWSWPKNHP